MWEKIVTAIILTFTPALFIFLINCESNGSNEEINFPYDDFSLIG